jgi:hypothetical protein
MPPQSLYFEFEEQKVLAKSAEFDLNNVVLMVCDEPYCGAVANLIVSLRIDGGHEGDIAVIVEQSQNYTKKSLEADIDRESKGMIDGIVTNATIYIWSTDELFDALQLDEKTQYLKDCPPLAECLKDYPKRKHKAFYLKSLMFHPIFTKWNTVLFMDACMTIHSPHIFELFQLPEVKGHILASPDPWYWGRRGIAAKFVKDCPDHNTTQIVATLVKKSDLTKVRYFASGLILFDTSIIKTHGTTLADTVIEISTLYHTLSKLFVGDQEILSIYWVYVRTEFRVLPLAMFESNRVPYEFVKRIPGDPHIITAGHKSRDVCTKRSTNSRTT